MLESCICRQISANCLPKTKSRTTVETQF